VFARACSCACVHACLTQANMHLFVRSMCVCVCVCVCVFVHFHLLRPLLAQHMTTSPQRPNMMQVYGVYDEKCPTASGLGKPGSKMFLQAHTLLYTSDSACLTLFWSNMMYHCAELGYVSHSNTGEHIPYIILEHCPCTDLFSFLESRGAFPMRLARHYFLQLMNGVSYIHDKSTSHR
jgi:serine/threonine protein kinase